MATPSEVTFCDGNDLVPFASHPRGRDIGQSEDPLVGRFSVRTRFADEDNCVARKDCTDFSAARKGKQLEGPDLTLAWRSWGIGDGLLRKKNFS